MNAAMTRQSRYRRERKLSKILLIVAAIVLFAGLFSQIYLRAQLAGQAKELAALQREIKTLSANAGNLDLSINQRHNLEDIATKAILLGMKEQPDETQLRVVSLPAANTDTSTHTVAIDGGEKIG